MFIVTEGVTDKEALIKLNGIKSCICEEGFRIELADVWKRRSFSVGIKSFES